GPSASIHRNRNSIRPSSRLPDGSRQGLILSCSGADRQREICDNVAERIFMKPFARTPSPSKGASILAAAALLCPLGATASASEEVLRSIGSGFGKIDPVGL